MGVIVNSLSKMNITDIEIDIDIRPVPSLYPDSSPPKLIITTVAVMVGTLMTALCCFILWLQYRSRTERSRDSEEETYSGPIYRAPPGINVVNTTAFTDHYYEVEYPFITRIPHIPAYDHDFADKKHVQASSENSKLN